MYNSIPNVTNRNNRFKIVYKNEEKDIVLPIGAYEISAINEFIQKEIRDHGWGDLIEIKQIITHFGVSSNLRRMS